MNRNRHHNDSDVGPDHSDHGDAYHGNFFKAFPKETKLVILTVFFVMGGIFMFYCAYKAPPQRSALQKIEGSITHIERGALSGPYETETNAEDTNGLFIFINTFSNAIRVPSVVQPSRFISAAHIGDSVSVLFDSRSVFNSDGISVMEIGLPDSRSLPSYADMRREANRQRLWSLFFGCSSFSFAIFLLFQLTRLEQLRDRLPRSFQDSDRNE